MSQLDGTQRDTVSLLAEARSSKKHIFCVYVRTHIIALFGNEDKAIVVNHIAVDILKWKTDTEKAIIYVRKDPYQVPVTKRTICIIIHVINAIR